MKKANLVDIFSLSSDPESGDQVEELLARLESEEPTNLLEAEAREDCLSGIFISWRLSADSNVHSPLTH